MRWVRAAPSARGARSRRDTRRTTIRGERGRRPRAPPWPRRARRTRRTVGQYALLRRRRRSSCEKARPIAPQPYLSSTRRRAAAACRRRAEGSARSPETAAAKPSTESAIRISAPSARSSPSAPTEVDTTGTPQAAASRIFSLVPAAARSGTTATAARAQCGRVSPPAPRRRETSSSTSRRPARRGRTSAGRRRSAREGQPGGTTPFLGWGGHARSPTRHDSSGGTSLRNGYRSSRAVGTTPLGLRRELREERRLPLGDEGHACGARDELGLDSRDARGLGSRERPGEAGSCALPHPPPELRVQVVEVDPERTEFVGSERRHVVRVSHDPGGPLLRRESPQPRSQRTRPVEKGRIGPPGRVAARAAARRIERAPGEIAPPPRRGEIAVSRAGARKKTKARTRKCREGYHEVEVPDRGTSRVGWGGRGQIG